MTAREMKSLILSTWPRLRNTSPDMIVVMNRQLRSCHAATDQEVIDVWHRSINTCKYEPNLGDLIERLKEVRAEKEPKPEKRTGRNVCSACKGKGVVLKVDIDKEAVKALPFQEMLQAMKAGASERPCPKCKPRKRMEAEG